MYNHSGTLFTVTAPCIVVLYLAYSHSHIRTRPPMPHIHTVCMYVRTFIQCSRTPAQIHTDAPYVHELCVLQTYVHTYIHQHTEWTTAGVAYMLLLQTFIRTYKNSLACTALEASQRLRIQSQSSVSASLSESLTLGNTGSRGPYAARPRQMPLHQPALATAHHPLP